MKREGGSAQVGYEEEEQEAQGGGGGGGGGGEGSGYEEMYEYSQLFRCTEKGSRTIFTPRVVLADLRENLGSLDVSSSTLAARHEDEEVGETLWSGNLARMIREDVPEMNPFQHFLQNCSADSYNSRGRGASSHASAFMPRPKESCIKSWTDFHTTQLHSRSMCTLPLWTTRGKFDTFLSASNADVLPVAYMEEYMDSVRFFAEECDCVSTIQILADLHDGFGGMAASVVRELREEYHSVDIPIFAFTEPFTSASPIRSGHAIPTMNSAIASLGVPKAYAALSEHASVLVPIDPRASAHLSPFLSPETWTPYHSSAIVASAIDALTSFQHINTSVGGSEGTSDHAAQSSEEWIFGATNAGRFRVSALEATLPFVYPPTESLEQWLTENFESWDTRGSSGSREKQGGGGEATTRTGGAVTLNPFSTSLSAVAYGSWSVPLEQRQRPGRCFSNVVSIRGPSRHDISSLLYTKCLDSSYLLTACFQRQSPLCLSPSFPHFFRGVDQRGFIHSSSTHHQSVVAALPTTSCSQMTTIAAVGCDASMMLHLNRIAEGWIEGKRQGAVRAQLEKAGVNSEEQEEIRETILTLARVYDSHVEL